MIDETSLNILILAVCVLLGALTLGDVEDDGSSPS